MIPFLITHPGVIWLNNVYMSKSNYTIMMELGEIMSSERVFYVISVWKDWNVSGH